VIDSVGTPARPLSIEQILAKGDGLAAHGFTASVRSRLAEFLWNNATDSRALAQAFAYA
jgi:hypothetical protein